jgi:ATP/maltotriose-dependent transcriptional regulator MalT
MFRLLSLLAKNGRHADPLPERYLHAVLDAAKTYSMLFPALYQQGFEQENDGPPVMTASELRILQLLCAGKTNREIGEELGIKTPTVKFHIAHIFEKIGVSNRAGAVNTAQKLKIL